MFGLVCAATAGVGVFDQQIRDETQEKFQQDSPSRFLSWWQQLGMEYSAVEVAAFEAWGLATQNPTARSVARDGVTASVISGGITRALKAAIGRRAPRADSSAYVFEPFGGDRSFPSGHSTEAFAMATVIAHYYPKWWQQSMAYGAAALVGVALVQQDLHYASEVVAGSAIGWSVGHAVVSRSDAKPPAMCVQAWGRKHGVGIVLTKAY